MKILFVVGSFREKSYNRQLAKHGEEVLGQRASIEYLDYESLPFINEDTEFPTHPEVQKVWDKVNEADGIWLFCPEYNSSYPGHVKNLFDWLSRPYEKDNYSLGTAGRNKKITISNVAGRSCGLPCREKLLLLFDKIGMDPMTSPNLNIALDDRSYDTGVLYYDEGTEKRLKKQADAFLDFIGKN